MSKNLTLKEIIFRSVDRYPESVVPLMKILEVEKSIYFYQSKAVYSKEQLQVLDWKWVSAHISELQTNDMGKAFLSEVLYNKFISDGSNDFGDKRAYKVILQDVAGKYSLEQNGIEEQVEQELIKHFFKSAWQKMSNEEQKELLKRLNINSQSNLNEILAASAFLVGGLAARLFAFEVSAVVSAWVVRSLAIEGATAVAGGVIGRTAGVFLGPIGWIASGAWLLYSLAEPAYSRVVPAIVQIAFLRQQLSNCVHIGIVGAGSAGKDSTVAAIFDLPGNPDPIAGSTSEAETFDIFGDDRVLVSNFPGFGDYREHVEEVTKSKIRNCDVFLVVMDVSRGCDDSELKILKNLKSLNKHFVICVNKVDILKEKTKEKTFESIEKRIRDAGINSSIVFTAFDPHPSISPNPIGIKEVQVEIISLFEEFFPEIDVQEDALFSRPEKILELKII